MSNHSIENKHYQKGYQKSNIFMLCLIQNHSMLELQSQHKFLASITFSNSSQTFKCYKKDTRIKHRYKYSLGWKNKSERILFNFCFFFYKIIQIIKFFLIILSKKKKRHYNQLLTSLQIRHIPSKDGLEMIHLHIQQMSLEEQNLFSKLAQ